MTAADPSPAARSAATAGASFPPAGGAFYGAAPGGSPDEPSTTKGNAFGALRHRDFRVLATGNMVSQLGTWVQYVAIGWVARELTDSSLLISIVFAAQWFPFLLLSPFTGVIADRYDRRRIVLWGNVSMVLPAVVLGLLTAAGSIGIASLALLVVLGGVGSAFTQPAASAFVPSLVPASDVHGAIALNAGLTSSTRVIGPTIGGALITALGVSWGFHINAVSFLAVSIACATISVSGRVPSNGPTPFFANLRSGLTYARANAATMRILLLLTAVTFFLMHAGLMSIMAKDVLGGGVGTYGFLSSGPGFGFVVAAVVCAMLPTDRARCRALLLSAAGTGIALVAIAVSRSVLVTFSAMGVFGAAYMTVNTVASTLLIGTCENEYRGRVMGLFGMVGTGIFTINSLTGGAIAALIGAPWTIGLCGAAVLATVAVFTLTDSINVIINGLAAQRSRVASLPTASASAD